MSYKHTKHTHKVQPQSVTLQAKASENVKGNYLTDQRAAPVVQQKENSTGLPDDLKTGIENLSGHSMDDVKVHYNSSEPAQLNAHAYAQGNQIHIAPGQEQHVPHEAWHVVQQKQGRVEPTLQMKGKVNVNDDSSLEKEADVMGAKAVQRAGVSSGQLRTHIPKQDTVQGYFLMHAEDGVFMMAQERRQTETGSSFLREDGKPNLSMKMSGEMRVSDDGQMAIENGGNSRQAKTFYASDKVLKSANGMLRTVGSPIRLATHPGMVITVMVHNKERKLSLTYPIDLQAKKTGHELEIPQNCDDAGPYISHTANSRFLETTYKTGHPYVLSGGTLDLYSDTRLAALLPFLLKESIEKNKGVARLFFETMSPWWRSISPELTTLRNGRHMDLVDYIQWLGRDGGEPNNDVHNGLDLIGERYIKEFINKVGSKEIVKAIGINQYINPEVGDLLSIRSIAPVKMNEDGSWNVKDHESGRTLRNPFQFHFATVIAKAGKDYITMENYARKEEEGHPNSGTSLTDPRYFFQMFGPKEQSFHSESKHEYANPITLSFRPNRQPINFGYDLGSDQVNKVVDDYNMRLSSMNL